VYNDRDKQAIFENNHEPIIDLITHGRRVQELRKQRKRPNRFDEWACFPVFCSARTAAAASTSNANQTEKRKQDCYTAQLQEAYPRLAPPILSAPTF
jgi:hypothetical protein